jgi:hypothetical protein
MTDDKVIVDELTVEELSEVKGGIPYEKPELFSLEEGNIVCAAGVICRPGHGAICDVGTFDPDG